MNKLLIVTHALNDFITGARRNDETINAFPTLIDKIKQHSGGIYATCPDTQFDEYQKTLEKKKIKLPWARRNKFTEGWEIEKNVREAMNDKCSLLIHKDFYHWVRLKECLERFDEIELVGFYTDSNVFYNAISLRCILPFMKITVDAACCAGNTPENHKAALFVMKRHRIDVVNE